jgi:hypothetical protein
VRRQSGRARPTRLSWRCAIRSTKSSFARRAAIRRAQGHSRRAAQKPDQGDGGADGRCPLSQRPEIPLQVEGGQTRGRLPRPLSPNCGRLTGDPRKRSLRRRASTNDAGLPHIPEVGPTRPSSSVRVTQFNSGEIALIRQKHVHTRLNIAELRDGAFCQREMRCRATALTEMDLCGRIILILPDIFPRHSHDANFRGVEIGPASARLAA